jgi:Na+/H+-dicarboxylate symporter
MSLPARVLIGLGLGLVGGIVASFAQGGFLRALPDLVEPIGTLWVNAIRMTVVPLVVSLLVVAIAGERKSRMVATVGARTVGLFVVMIAAVSLFAALVAPPLLALLRLDPATAESLRATTGTATPAAVELPPFRDWLVDLVPSNPLQAAVEGAMLPLIVFTGAFAFALNRIGDDARDVILRFFTAVKDSMFVLIGWILEVAPIGVFALVLPLAARMGAAAAGAFGYFVLVASTLVVVAMLALYPITALAGRIPLRRFARAFAPAQVVGFSTRSSLASLPAMFASTERLDLPPKITGLVLPVAASVFKFSSPIVRTTGTLFIAKLYGIDLGVPEIAAIAAAIGLLSFYSPGVPSGGLFVMTPVYLSLDLPVEGIGILIALDMIPDMFITTANVTADMTAAVLLSRSEPTPMVATTDGGGSQAGGPSG